MKLACTLLVGLGVGCLPGEGIVLQGDQGTAGRADAGTDGRDPGGGPAPADPDGGVTGPDTPDGGPAVAVWDQAVWPGGPRAGATALFNEAPGSTLGQDNWSGAHWNDATQTLWLARNNTGFRSYVAAGAGWQLLGDYPTGGDLEGITAGPQAGQIYVIAENDQEMRLYDTNAGVASLASLWDVSGIVPGGDGLEGLTFVPDSVLVAAGFRDGAGTVFTASAGAAGGLFMISHQNGGEIYAVDLLPAGQISVVGSYLTPLASTRGIELDRATGYLVIVDGNGAARLRLSSTAGAFDVVNVYPGPGPDGAEGIAVPPSDADLQWAVITDDDNLAGNAAVLRYDVRVR